MKHGYVKKALQRGCRKYPKVWGLPGQGECELRKNEAVTVFSQGRLSENSP